MTQTYLPFDAGSGSNVTESQWTKMARLWLPTGVLDGYLNELATFADSTGMQVKVPSGGAWMQGHYFDNDAQVTLAIAAADPTNPRIDRVIVRVDWTANTIALAVLTGTAAGSPTAPALTQSASTWEISLAQVAVAAAASTIAAGNVTDERQIVGHVNGVFRGTGDPEGSVVAQQGSMFLRTDGGSGTSLYVKYTSGLNAVGWERTGGSSMAPNTISTMDADALGGPKLVSIGLAVGSSATTWPASNRALFVPFRLGIGATLKRLYVANGTAVSGNICLGLYNSSFTRLLTSGSMAHAGVSALQFYDPADTPLAVGLYYLALAVDNTSAKIAHWTVSNSGSIDPVSTIRDAGMFQQAAAFVLPATATPAVVATNLIPYIGAEFGVIT